MYVNFVSFTLANKITFCTWMCLILRYVNYYLLFYCRNLPENLMKLVMLELYYYTQCIHVQNVIICHIGSPFIGLSCTAIKKKFEKHAKFNFRRGKIFKQKQSQVVIRISHILKDLKMSFPYGIQLTKEPHKTRTENVDQIQGIKQFAPCQTKLVHNYCSNEYCTK